MSSKKDSRIEIRITLEEKQELNRLIKLAGFSSYSIFFRHKIANQDWKSGEQPETKEAKKSLEISNMLKNEMKKIGTNVNQVVKKLNSTHGNSDLKILIGKLLKQQEELDELLNITVEKFSEYIHINKPQ